MTTTISSTTPSVEFLADKPKLKILAEAAAHAIAERRGLRRINHEHPMWEYFMQDALAVIKAMDDVRT